MELIKEWVTDIGTEQKVYRAANNYGVSVVKGAYTYGGDEGLWELAVLRFSDESINSAELCYDTEITDDVLGRLEQSEVDELLARIAAL